MEGPNSLYKRGYALLACIIILFYVFLAKPLGCFIELLTNNLDCGQRCLHCFLDIVKILKIWTRKKIITIAILKIVQFGFSVW